MTNQGSSHGLRFGLVGLLLPGAVLAALAAPDAGAVPIVQHVGSIDPTTEGWTKFNAGAVTAGPVSDGGTPAWNFVDGGGYWYYSYNVAGVVGDPGGWTATVRARIVNNPAMAGGLAVQDGQDGWVLDLRDGGVWYLDGSSSSQWVQFLAMDTQSAYHTYQVIYNPAANDRAGVYVDGAFRGDLLRSQVVDYPGLTDFYWGVGSSSGVGESNFTYASFETGQHPAGPTAAAIPEPSLAALAGLALAALGWGMTRRAVGRR